MIPHLSECWFQRMGISINVTNNVSHKRKKNPVSCGYEVLAKCLIWDAMGGNN